MDEFMEEGWEDRIEELIADRVEELIMSARGQAVVREFFPRS